MKLLLSHPLQIKKKNNKKLIKLIKKKNKLTTLLPPRITALPTITPAIPPATPPLAFLFTTFIHLLYDKIMQIIKLTTRNILLKKVQFGFREHFDCVYCAHSSNIHPPLVLPVLE
jgi:hypothetical protein